MNCPDSIEPETLAHLGCILLFSFQRSMLSLCLTATFTIISSVNYFVKKKFWIILN